MSEWQPIETAPKDNTDFLATDGKTVVYCIWSGNICAFDWKGASKPTHWMPLPSPSPPIRKREGEMSGERPVEIPEWAWDKACEAMNRAGWHMCSVRIEAAKAILSAVEEEREACAEVARNWLHNWANDLVDTRDSYIDAKSTGKHNGRRMGREDADFYAKQFRERADAVSDCVEHVASAIRNRKES